MGGPFLMSSLQAASRHVKPIHLLAVVYDIAESRAPGVRCGVPKHCHHDDIYVTYARCQVLFAIALRSLSRLIFSDADCKFFIRAHW